jgi:uncharacterized protein (TIGR00297 family)
MPRLLQITIGFILALAIGLIAYRRGSLSKSGVAGATLIGATIFGLGGWEWSVLLVVFFVSSSALSHYKESLKESLAEKFSKGSRRDLAQTLANGGAGALMVIANFLWPSPLWWAAFAGALATVNADTWATELGVLSKTRPRLITSGAEVEVGASGGITRAGSAAALGGAALVGLAAAGFYFAWSQSPLAALALFTVAALSGLAGSMTDSTLGATVQAIYYCEACGKETERSPTHTCGQPTRYRRGRRWLDNDWVNFLSSGAGAALAAGLWWALMR